MNYIISAAIDFPVKRSKLLYTFFLFRFERFAMFFSLNRPSFQYNTWRTMLEKWLHSIGYNRSMCTAFVDNSQLGVFYVTAYAIGCTERKIRRIHVIGILENDTHMIFCFFSAAFAGLFSVVLELLNGELRRCFFCIGNFYFYVTILLLLLCLLF